MQNSECLTSFQISAYLTSASCLHFQRKAEMVLPVAIQDYTDFFSSMYHAQNCGAIFRGSQNPMLPNWFVDSECGANKLFSRPFSFLSSEN